MKRSLAVCCVLVVASFVAAQDAKLPEKVVVKDLQGGFAGLTGKQWTIETDGKWEEATVGPRDKVTVVRSGTLKKEQIEALAKELKTYDAGKLKDEGKVGTNPKVFSVSYGKSEAKLTLKTGAELPKVDAKTNEGRIAGVVAAVKAAIPAEKK